MKLTVYLLRESVTDLSEAILARYRESGEYVEVKQKTTLPFHCRAWLQRNKTRPPRWLPWLQEVFEVEDVVNQSNSFVVVLEASGRYFAVTFGYGFTAIDRTLVEPDFGLKVALNTIDPDEIDMLDARTVDRMTKQTRIHLNVGRPVEDFGVDAESDWIRSVRGKTKSERLTGRIYGSDAVRITWNDRFETLRDCCEHLLDLYQSEEYKRNFWFVDNLRRVKETDPLVESLEGKVVELLEQRDREHLAVAHPGIPHSDVETFKIWSGRIKLEDLYDLDLDSVFGFIDKYKKGYGRFPDLHKTWVIGLDSSKQSRSSRTALWNYLVAHVDDDDRIYILSLGQWFVTEKNYVDKLRREVAAIQDITELLDLPAWDKGMRESEYNDQVAQSRNWLLLDRRSFKIEEPRGKIECADLLTENGDFIHVKAMSDSATLSHLFAQGTVSARLFRSVPEYRETIKGMFVEKFGKELTGGRVVFAIGTEREGSIEKNLFFFSLVNLVQHKRMLDAMGWPVAICRIERK